MPTPAPRPRGYGSLQGRLREDRKDREQIRRLLSQPAKPRAATAAGGLGTTRVYPGAASQSLGSTSSIQWTSAGWTSEAAGGAAPAVTWDDYLRVVDAGFYLLTLRGRFWWNIDGTEPSWVTADFRGASNGDAATQGWQPYVKGSQREIEVCHTFGGPWLLAAGDALSLSLQWQGSQPVQIGVGQPRLDVTRVG